MEIGKILYPVTTLGIGVRLAIWTRGCRRLCPGCSNPELQSSDPSTNIEVDVLLKELEKYSFDGVTISGGEPFFQTKDLRKLVEGFNDHGIEDILIFTGYTRKELDDMNDDDVNFILNHISVLIDGPYDKNKPSNKILIGSKNQKVHIINPLFEDRYAEYLKKDKQIDVFKFGNEVHFIGVPEPNYEDKYKKVLGRKK